MNFIAEMRNYRRTSAKKARYGVAIAVGCLCPLLLAACTTNLKPAPEARTVSAGRPGIQRSCRHPSYGHGGSMVRQSGRSVQRRHTLACVDREPQRSALAHQFSRFQARQSPILQQYGDPAVQDGRDSDQAGFLAADLYSPSRVRIGAALPHPNGRKHEQAAPSLEL